MKKIWRFLSGKKTNIGGTVNALLMWVAIKGWLDEPTLIMLGSIATIWFGMAIGHKFNKSVKTKAAEKKNGTLSL